MAAALRLRSPGGAGPAWSEHQHLLMLPQRLPLFLVIHVPTCLFCLSRCHTFLAGARIHPLAWLPVLWLGMPLLDALQVAESALRGPLARRDTTKTQIAVIVVCVILIVGIVAGVGGWFLWRRRRKPQRVQAMAKSAMGLRIDDAGERDQPSHHHHQLMDERSIATTVGPPASVSKASRGVGGVEGWIQSTQRAAPVGPQEVPRTPRAGAAASVHDAPVPPSPPPPMSMGTVGREGPFDRPASVHSSHNLHSRQSSEQGHQQGANHARPLAFIKNMFGQPGNPNQLEDIPSEGGLTPSVAKLPMMSGNSHEPHPFAAQQGPHYPNRPMRPDSLVLSQSAYEIYPDASASQYGGRSGRRNGSGDDQVPPMPSDRHGRGSTGLGRRGSYGAMSSQGGLPLPSFYLPSEPGDSSLPGALPIGESVLASPLETRQPHGGLEPPRRGPRRPGSNFVVTNATHSDED